MADAERSDRSVRLRIAREFSPYPAGRYRKDGPYSGEQFRDDLLWPLIESGKTVVVDIDDVAGLPSSFWEEVFGGLVRQHKMTPEDVRTRVAVDTSQKHLEPFIRLAHRFSDEAAVSR